MNTSTTAAPSREVLFRLWDSVRATMFRLAGLAFGKASW